MGSGLSMTSVNKIKELAGAREYILALEIIDSQDLSRSLNPQFLRLCGEIYTINGRYDDARRTFIMAHRLAPEAKRVIYSFVDLYLRIGYRKLAEFYYNVYMSDADENAYETKHINYIYQKATGGELSDIEVLISTYRDNMDYDWSYELVLLLKLQGKDEFRDIAEDYLATYKNTKNANIVMDILDDKVDVAELFYIYAKEEVPDDNPKLEQLREEERVLMEADDIRVNPREAEIQIVFDDDEVIFGSKRKYKKHLKEQEKLAKKALKEQENSAEDENSEIDQNSENTEMVNVSEDISEKDASGELSDKDDEQEEAVSQTSVNIFKKLFSRKKKALEDEDETDIEETENEDTEADAVETENEDTEADIEETYAEDDVDETSDSEEEENVDTDEGIGVSDMREIYSNGEKKISVVSDLGDVDFSADVADVTNPFDEMVIVDKDEVEDEMQEETKEETKSINNSFVFEDAELEPEYDGEDETDDFSDSEYDFSSSEDSVPEEAVYEEEEIYETEETEETQEEIISEVFEEEICETEECEEDSTSEVFEEIICEAEEEKEENVSASEEVDEYTEMNSVVSDRDAIFAGVKEKNRMDFPVFKTNLFPEYNKDVVEVENNFNEIMNEAQDKINENLIKEEQMQREAEALLASLGISLDDVKPTSNTVAPRQNVFQQETTEDTTPKVEEQIQKNSPSRDELKESLKIDSVKKDILKRLKEYR